MFKIMGVPPVAPAAFAVLRGEVYATSGIGGRTALCGDSTGYFWACCGPSPALF